MDKVALRRRLVKVLAESDLTPEELEFMIDGLNHSDWKGITVMAFQAKRMTKLGNFTTTERT